MNPTNRTLWTTSPPAVDCCCVCLIWTQSLLCSQNPRRASSSSRPVIIGYCMDSLVLEHRTRDDEHGTRLWGCWLTAPGTGHWSTTTTTYMFTLSTSPYSSSFGWLVVWPSHGSVILRGNYVVLCCLCLYFWGLAHLFIAGSLRCALRWCKGYLRWASRSLGFWFMTVGGG